MYFSVVDEVVLGLRSFACLGVFSAAGWFWGMCRQAAYSLMQENQKHGGPGLCRQ